jgi:hypothetical protein
MYITQILDQYDFGPMKLHDVAVTPDGTRLLGVGPLLQSPTGLQPSKSRGEKRLVGAFLGVDCPGYHIDKDVLPVYNTELKQIEQ